MPISIVMPTYNRLQYLREAVDSVLGQSYSAWELIISDDGSQDGTREYLKSLEDPRIRVYLQDLNLGQFGNLNFLFGQARHEISQILCDDDYLADRAALARLVEQWKAVGAEVGFIRANHDRGNAICSLTRFECEIVPDFITPAESDLYFAIFGSLPGSLSNISVRTAIARANPFRTDLPYAGDFEMWARVARQSSFLMSPVRVSIIREHDGQIAAFHNRRGESVSQLRRIYEPIYERLRAQGNSSLLLRMMFTINVVSQQRYAGLKALLKRGEGAYLRAVMRELDHSSASLGPVLSWVAFLVSAGGRILRVQVARRLLAAKYGSSLKPEAVSALPGTL